MQLIPLCQGRICSSVYTETEISPAQCCSLPLESAGRYSVLPYRGTQPQPASPPSSVHNPTLQLRPALLRTCSLSPWATRTILAKSCSELLLKTFSCEDWTSSSCSLGWCFPFTRFLLTHFLPQGRILPLGLAITGTKKSCFYPGPLSALPQPFLSQPVVL